MAGRRCSLRSPGPSAPPAWLVGITWWLIIDVSLGRGLARHGADTPGPADRVTPTGATLTGGVATLSADSSDWSVTTLVAPSSRLGHRRR